MTLERAHEILYEMYDDAENDSDEEEALDIALTAIEEDMEAK